MGLRLPFLVVVLGAFNSNAQLVGPGGVAPYGSGGRRHGGYARVSQPGKGFFVAGSSIEGVNGVFERVQSLPTDLIALHNFSLAYRNRISDWVMALVDSPPADELGSRPYQAYGGLRNEWLLIDERHFDRIAHAGETIIPGSGERWGHVYESRYGVPKGVPVSRSAAKKEGKGEEEIELGPESQQVFSMADQEEEAARKLDELPWQVIMLGDEQMMRKFQRHCQYKEHVKREAARWRQESRHNGDGEAQAPPRSLASSAEAMAAALGPEAHAMAVEAEALESQARPGDRADWSTAAEAYGSAAAMALKRSHDLGASHSSSGGAEEAIWAAAVLYWFQATAYRRARELSKAESALMSGSLTLRPRYARAMHELALVRLDQGDYTGAIKVLEDLLRLDRDFPYLSTWLLRANAHARRAH